MERLLTVVLAAGNATRFGGGKLDAPCAGRPIGEWVLQAVARSRLPSGVVVTGPKAPAFLSAHPDWQRIVNPAPGEGLGGSLAVAAREGIVRGVDAMVVLLADMPLVQPDFLNAMAISAAPAATRHPGGPGVPALIPQRLFARLTHLRGDRGASSVLAADPALRLLDAPEYMLLDVDRQEDLARAEAWLQPQASGPSPRSAT